jgi:hypothetical protein
MPIEPVGAGSPKALKNTDRLSKPAPTPRKSPVILNYDSTVTKKENL